MQLHIIIFIWYACLIFFKISPLQNDIEMPIPKYFTHERAKALKEREKLLGQILAKLGPQDKDSVSTIIMSLLWYLVL